MSDDMARYFTFQNTLPQKWGNFEKDSEMNGQGGITVQSEDWLEYQNFLKWKTLNESWQRL